MFKLKKESNDNKKIETEKKNSKKSLLSRFYTTIFKNSKEQSDSKKNNKEQRSSLTASDDLTLGYLLKLSESLPIKLKNANNIDINDNKFVEKIMKELNTQQIDLNNLKNICYEGIPLICNHIRPICWKLLCKYLPIQKIMWLETIKRNKQIYEKMIDDIFLIKNKEIKMNKSVLLPERKEENIEKQNNLNFISCDDHPLSKAKNSNWNSFFSDQKLWDEIEKDTKRTKKHCDFFHEINDNNFNKKYPNLCRDRKESTNSSENHTVTITRLLFIYAKNNDKLIYVQGMNEIIATIYYCFYNDENEIFKENAEIDTYFSFCNFMQEIKDNFTLGPDLKIYKMENRMKTFSELLKKFEPKLWEHLKKLNINHEYFFTKWLILLLTQEFDLNEILMIWDPLFCSIKKLEYINYLIMGILHIIREELMDKDFSGCMEILQNLPKIEIKNIISYAYNLYREIETMKEK